MINKISSTNPVFTGYKQNFTDEEFKNSLQASLSWAKENVDHTKYFSTKKKMGKRLDRNAKAAINLLEIYKNIFKNPEMEPIIELSIEDKDLVGKVKYYHSNPIEARTQMPANFKDFFENLLTIAKAKMQEENLKTQLWHIREEEKYLEALQNRRYKELYPDNTTPNPLIIAFDSRYTSITEKLLAIIPKKNAIIGALEKVQSKLKGKEFKLKVK